MPAIVAALGEEALLRGYALAGAALRVAETDDDVRRHWAALGADARAGRVGLVLLTARAAAALGDALADRSAPLTAVLPS